MKHLSAAEISNLFRQWAKENGNAGAMPSPKQCRQIERALADDLPDEIREYDQQHGQEISRTIGLMHEIVETARILKKKLRNLSIYTEKTHGVGWRPYLDLTEQRTALVRLEHEVSDFADQYAGKTKSQMREEYSGAAEAWIANECEAALKAAGWRSNASRSSDNGPAMFVVGHVFDLPPATAGRRIRRYLKAEETTRANRASEKTKISFKRAAPPS